MKSFFYIKTLILTIIILYVSSLYVQCHGADKYASNSVLANGDWYKVSISETGIYKLTYEDLLKIGLGNPQNVKIYGYGGWILDEDFSKSYIDDLPEVSMWMNTTPESFGPGDYILFYGKGATKWSYNTSNGEFVHENNPYSSNSYYFLTENTSQPKLTEVVTSGTVLPQTVTFSNFDDYILHENDSVNLVNSGREFYGESFNMTRIQDFKFKLIGITSNTARIRYEFITAAKSSSPQAELLVSANNGAEKKNLIGGLSDSYAAAASVNNYLSTTSLSENTVLNVNYIPSSTEDKNSYLNYIRINYNRILKPYGSVTLFRNKIQTSSVQFEISESSNAMIVFDVTDNYVTKKIDATFDNVNSKLRFVASNSSIKEYALVDVSKEIPTPSIVGKIRNQNLHALPNADMIIIVQPNLQKYAEELAALHYEDSNITSVIANPEDIYNEFSSGKPDATAYRRFAKMFYDRKRDNASLSYPRYLLLFGNGSFDNKNVLGKSFSKEMSKNLLLTYQSINSLSTTASYTSDDYFGFLEDNEGANLNIATLDIGVGRLPVSSEYEASNVLNKIKRYIKNEDKGNWLNTTVLVADDAIPAFSTTANLAEVDHLKYTELYATTLFDKYPAVAVNKIYQDAYPKVSLRNGVSSPKTEAAIQKSLNDGALVLNYVGHGTTKNWTYDESLTYEQVLGLKNTRLPLWIIATCEFSRFDENRTSGGVQTLLNPDGGAIALFASIRTVYSINNHDMTTAFFKHIFEKKGGREPRLGDIMRDSKNDSIFAKGDGNKLRFALLGDPALKLNYAYSKSNVVVKSINDELISGSVINLKSMNKTTIKGEIVDENGNVINNYNGILESTIYDNIQDLKTLGNGKSASFDPTRNYQDYISVLYNGKVNITNGKFEFSFIVPQEVLNTGGNGKMIFHAHDTAKSHKDVNGAFTNYIVSNDGINSIPRENQPPTINKFYLNSESFQSGDTIYNMSPILYVSCFDTSGINLSGMFGRNILLIIDGVDTYDITSSFISNGADQKSGQIIYQLPVLDEGMHTINLRIGDIWNNLQSSSLSFTIVDNNKPYKFNMSSQENITDKNTDIFFSMINLEEPDVNLNIQIYAPNGTLLWTHRKSDKAKNLRNYNYKWSWLNDEGEMMNPGTYNCKVTISIGKNVVDTISEKITIPKQ